MPGKDIPGQGDVHHIPNWPATHTLDQLKAMVVEKRWSGVTLGKPGQGGAGGGAWFKKVGHILTNENTRNSAIDCIWVYAPAVNESQWTKIPDKDIAGQGDVHHIPNGQGTHTLDQLKELVI